MKRLWMLLLTLACCLALAGCSAAQEPPAPLTLETVQALAEEKGEALTWDDFAAYASEDTGSGLYIQRYALDGGYSLLVGGGSLEEAPLYIRLVSDEDPDRCIDIRTEDVAAFLEGEDAPEEPDPLLAEFSLVISGQSLTLGIQSGAFPWGTALREAESNFWSSDGFDCFEITCEDGTVLSGFRPEGVEDTTDGTLSSITTSNTAYATPRGVHPGMTVEEVLALYPEAERRVNVEPDDHSYTYTNEAIGFSQIVFWFQDDVLLSLTIVNGMDGYLY